MSFKKRSRVKMNPLGPTGLGINVTSFILNVLAAFCVFKLILTPVVGAILAIFGLVAASVGLTMTVIARNEIVENVQTGDGFAISGMVVGIVMCTLSSAVLALYFLLFA